MPAYFASFQKGQLNVLLGNLFDCSSFESSFGSTADNDPYAARVNCGSGALNDLMVAFSIFFIVVVVFVVVVARADARLRAKRKLAGNDNRNNNANTNTHASFTAGIGAIGSGGIYALWCRTVEKYAAMLSLYRRPIRAESRSFSGLSQTQLTLLGVKPPGSSSGNEQPMSNVYKFIDQLKICRYFVIIFGLVSIFLVPVYVVLKEQGFGTVETQYGWTPSAAFLSGKSLVVILLVVIWTLLFIMLRIFYSLIRKKQSASKAADSTTTLPAQEAETAAAGGANPSFSRTTYFFLCINLATLLAIDVSFMFLANVGYIYVLMNGDTTQQGVATISLASTKYLWNRFILSNLLSGKWFQYRFTIQEHRNFVTRLFGSFGFLDTLVQTFNTIVLPIVASVLTDSNCFLDILFAAEPISGFSYYTYKGLTLVSIYSPQSKPTILQGLSLVNFSVPFIYNNSCISALISNYTNVFLLLFFEMVGSVGFNS